MDSFANGHPSGLVWLGTLARSSVKESGSRCTGPNFSHFSLPFLSSQSRGPPSSSGYSV